MKTITMGGLGGGDDPTPPDKQLSKDPVLDTLVIDVWEIILEYLELSGWIVIRSTNRSLRQTVDAFVTGCPNLVQRVHRAERLRILERYLRTQDSMAQVRTGWARLALSSLIEDTVRSAARVDMIAEAMSRFPGSTVNPHLARGDAVERHPGYARARTEGPQVLFARPQAPALDTVYSAIVIAIIAFIVFVLMRV